VTVTDQIEAPPIVRVDGLSKQFSRMSEQQAVSELSLDVAHGEFVVLLGPSGCGKTTLLRMIAGLESPSSGRIAIRDRVVYDSQQGIDVPPQERRLGVVFQSYALWPHLTVMQNVAYPLGSVQRWARNREENLQRATEMLEVVGIAETANRYPNEISGGQQQRVALARALVGGGDLILFDEPLSNVDAKVREELRGQLIEMQQRIGFAAIYVTHDQSEALALADRIAVMRGGELLQIATPEVLYDRPATRFIADFVGSMNHLPADVIKVTPDGGGFRVLIDTGIGRHEVTTTVDCTPGDRSITAAFRPERCRLRPATDRDPDPVVVDLVTFAGTSRDCIVSLGDQKARVMVPIDQAIAVGDRVVLEVADDDIRLYGAA
jgi:iron(III) transport system ATP-binding protein